MFNNNFSNNNYRKPYPNKSSNISSNTSNTSFEDNSKLNKIDPLKLKIILEIKKHSQNKSIEQMLPEIMNINRELAARGISFSKEETEILFDVLSESVPDAEKAKFNMIKGLIK